MRKLLVYADFDWIENELVGELNIENIRGGETYGFKFDNNWLKKHGDIILSQDLNNYSGWQYTAPGKDIFGCFSDALPDRWGRTLILRREQIMANEEKRPARRISSYDYLTGIDDESRMGGFRFKESPDGDFINSGAAFKIPPITSIRELMAASQEIEICEEKNILPEKKWLLQLVHPGTSLGGARPKACVSDENKQLFVAKFPSRKDLYNVGLWEHFAHQLAKKSGINVAETSTLQAGNKYSTLLSKRFDRTCDGRRIHLASAMTLLGLSDGDNASTGNGYLDIVDFIISNCVNVEANLKELYRRVAFNIAIGNSDDHFRNHGFLLTKKGWTLSPAYDINPTTNTDQSLLINSYTSQSDLDILLKSSSEYMLSQKDAEIIISEVRKAVSQWEVIANRLVIPEYEKNIFRERFSTSLS